MMTLNSIRSKQNTGSESQSEGSIAGSDKDGAADARSSMSQGEAKSEAQTIVESMATSVMQLTQAMHTQANAIALQSEVQSKALNAVMSKATCDPMTKSSSHS